MRFVYLATNERVPGLVKIGIADNVEERMRSLRGSGVPGSYEAKCVCKLRNAEQVERKMHALLRDKREDREFFRVDWIIAAGILMTLALETEKEGDAKPELAKWLRKELLGENPVEVPPEEEVVEDIQAPRRPSSSSRASSLQLSTDAKRRRDSFMTYLSNHMRLAGPTVGKKKAGLHYLGSNNIIDKDIFEITDIAKLRDILRRLRGGTGVYRISPYGNGREIIQTLGLYIEFLQQGGRR